MRLLITLQLVIIVIYAQQGAKGPPGGSGTVTKGPPVRVCFQPKESAIEELVEAKSAGKYPAAAIRKAIGATMRGKTKSELEDARGFGRGVCERYRSRTADAAPPSEKSFSSKTPLPFWRDTCPSFTRYFYFPRAVWYNREICWVLSPWNSLRCKWAHCIRRRCSGVRGIVNPFYQGITACGHSNYMSYYYYIWCRKAGFVRRYIRLPQCCSCKYLFCPWFKGGN